MDGASACAFSITSPYLVDLPESNRTPARKAVHISLLVRTSALGPSESRLANPDSEALSLSWRGTTPFVLCGSGAPSACALPLGEPPACGWGGCSFAHLRPAYGANPRPAMPPESRVCAAWHRLCSRPGQRRCGGVEKTIATAIHKSNSRC